jgi:hypothetical protein
MLAQIMYNAQDREATEAALLRAERAAQGTHEKRAVADLRQRMAGSQQGR